MNTPGLIVALDVSEYDHSLKLARAVQPWASMVKVGLEGFTAHGPRLVRALVDEGFDVFLDLKLHDIPHTVAAATRQAARLGARLLTVHALGGAHMITAAREAATSDLKIIAVTVLTSLEASDIIGLVPSADLSSYVYALGERAVAHGADGLVCSGHELSSLKPLGGLRVVPGVRPEGTAVGDQARVVTPEQAAALGASWVVVGRPITQAPDGDVAGAAERIAAALNIGEP